ncbi:uncharacterized protein A4U43_C10F13940 [Asparagus officinalis]|uniref:Uncharacterized protein n=1 Tax=Asparagus officinalis TaxID=4686 RepID=A0A5P1E5Y4_ASPOF|nr:uncharacterized protein A4U43_C10F13940 [Asparagus officinalis]
MCALYMQAKEPIPLNQEDIDDEEKVDYEADNNTYLTEPNDVGFEGDICSSFYRPNDELGLEAVGRVAPKSILASGEFKTSVDFDGVASALEFETTIDAVASPTPTSVSTVQHRLIFSSHLMKMIMLQSL